MVVVKIELWPHGQQEQARDIGLMMISNDCRGTKDVGSYNVTVSHGGRFWGRDGVWKQGRVHAFRRQLSPYHLIARALAACGIR